MNRRTFHKTALMLLTALSSPLLAGGGARQDAPLPLRGGDTENGPAAGPPGERPRVLRLSCSGALTGPVDGVLSLDAIDPGAVHAMLERGIAELTGIRDRGAAWRSLLAGYQRGDRIAIKPNFNFVEQGTQQTITAPELINAVVRQLVEDAGVRPDRISVYDLCKEIPGDLVRSRIAYPVRYVERPDARSLIGKVLLRAGQGAAAADRSAEIPMRRRIVDAEGAAVACYLPKVVTQTDHLINMPLLTNHPFLVNSGALKNHYGTVRFGNYNSYPAVLHGAVLADSVADINGSLPIRSKTRLIVADGLFGVFDRGDGPGKRPWKTFHDDFPRSIFLAQDPVAIDSVMAFLVARERRARGLQVQPHGYLEGAARQGLGVFDLPDGSAAFSRIDYEEIDVRQS